LASRGLIPQIKLNSDAELKYIAPIARIAALETVFGGQL
jgi:hypothetical protein